jgi:hypothetical protein
VGGARRTIAIVLRRPRAQAAENPARGPRGFRPSPSDPARLRDCLHGIRLPREAGVRPPVPRKCI